MRKIKNIREVYNQELFKLMQKERENFQRQGYYDNLAVDKSDQLHVVEIIHQHLYYFYLRHLREERVLVSETLNDKEKQVEIVFGANGK